jgi:hypothetical protein
MVGWSIERGKEEKLFQISTEESQQPKLGFVFCILEKNSTEIVLQFRL